MPKTVHMRSGVIGAGSMGWILARHLAKRGHRVSIANSRGPEIWTTRGGSSPERRLTAGILKPLLSGARAQKRIEAGSRTTAPNRRLVLGGISHLGLLGHADRSSMPTVSPISVGESPRS